MENARAEWSVKSEEEDRPSRLFLCTYKSNIRFTFPDKKPGLQGVFGPDQNSNEERWMTRRRCVEFPAHKFVLCRQSIVFQAMFYGPLANNVDTVKIEDIEPAIMKELLRFVYFGAARLSGDSVFQCVYAAKKYDIEGFVQECVSYLTDIINTENVCFIHRHAVFFDLATLQNVCVQFMLKHASIVLATAGFLELQHNTLLELLKSDELITEEVDVFRACVCWSEHKCKVKNEAISPSNLRRHLGDAIFEIRFPVMCKHDFLDSVIPTTILTNDEESEICDYHGMPFPSTLDRFISRERTGRQIVVDMSSYKYLHRTIITYGCQLCISRPRESRDIGKTQYCLRLKAITGAFVQTLLRVFSVDPDGRKTEIEEYKVDTCSSTIIFAKAMEITENNHISFQTCEVSTHNNGYGVLVSVPKGPMFLSETFRNTLEVNDNGLLFEVKQIPKDLVSLTFLK